MNPSMKRINDNLRDAVRVWRMTFGELSPFTPVGERSLESLMDLVNPDGPGDAFSMRRADHA